MYVYGQLLKAQIENQASNPIGTASGLVYYNTSANEILYYDGTAWRTLVTKTTAQTLLTKSFDDATCAFVDTSDSTKKIKFDAAGTTGTSTTLLGSQTADRILTLPNATDTLVGKATSDVFTNKTFETGVNTFKRTVTTKTTTYLAAATDDIILCSGSAFTVTLPAAAGLPGKVFLFKKTDSSIANIITIDGNLSETIDGALTKTLNVQYETLQITSDGTNWVSTAAVTTRACWSGYHASDTSWSRSNTAYGDPAADTTSTFTEVVNSGMGTVTSYLSGSDKLPGVVFTPPKTAVYRITAVILASSDNNSTASFQMTAGGTYVSEGQVQADNANNNVHPLTLTGLFSGTANTSTTVKIQMKASSGACVIISFASVPVINWTIEQVT